MQKKRKTKLEKQIEAQQAAIIQRAVSGFLIPMLSIPKMYSAMEAALAEGASDADLKAIVAGWPGVKESV